MDNSFYRGEKLLIRDVSALQLASCSFEFIDQAGFAMLVVAARTDVANLERIEARFARPNLGKDGELLFCSFCGKSQLDVAKLIAGPSVYVCDECIGICNEIIADDAVKDDSAKAEPKTKRKKRRPKGEA